MLAEKQRMNLFRKIAITAGLMGVAGVAGAQVSSTITGTNDYDFRGFSQTAKDPAIQASLDYAFGESGFAVGAWASNVDFGDDNDADIELDLYASYGASINDNLGWSVGATYYAYPGSDDTSDYPEIYAGLDVGPVSLKQWYSWDFYGQNPEVDAMYTEANASFALPAGFSLLLHAGYSWGDYWEGSLDDGFGGGELFDYSIGVGYELDNFSLALKLVGTDADGEQKVTGDVFNNEDRVVFTVSTTLPWGE